MRYYKFKGEFKKDIFIHWNIKINVQIGVKYGLIGEGRKGGKLINSPPVGMYTIIDNNYLCIVIRYLKFMEL